MTAATDTADAAPPKAPPTPLSSAIGTLISHLAKRDADRGALAALRRLDPDNPTAPAFIVLLLDAEAEATKRQREAGPDRAEPGPSNAVRGGAWTIAERDAPVWALIVRGMALTAPDHHATGLRVGTALHQAGISEARVARMLAARGVQFRAHITRVIRQLAQHRQPADWQELARLILAEAGVIRDLDQRRHRIARAYYGAQHRS